MSEENSVPEQSATSAQGKEERKTIETSESRGCSGPDVTSPLRRPLARLELLALPLRDHDRCNVHRRPHFEMLEKIAEIFFKRLVARGAY